MSSVIMCLVIVAVALPIRSNSRPLSSSERSDDEKQSSISEQNDLTTATPQPNFSVLIPRIHVLAFRAKESMTRSAPWLPNAESSFPYS